LYLRGEVFLRVALVRVKAKVVGYLTEDIGVLEVKDGEGIKKAVFNTNDVKLFRKDLAEFDARPRHLIPVGLTVSIDARRVHITGVRDIEYQAISVLAGPWPITLHPTLLPGGQGSLCGASYDVPDDHTFYYLELALEAKLRHKVSLLIDALGRTRGQLQYDLNDVAFIRGAADHQSWKEQFTGPMRNTRKKNPREYKRQEVSHLFKAPPPRPVEIKEPKDETDSVVAMAGSSAGSISGVGSVFSRPSSAMSLSSHTSGSRSVSSRTCSESNRYMETFQERNWYNRQNWELGGLRLKTEVKAEQEDGPSPAKRTKIEARN